MKAGIVVLAFLAVLLALYFIVIAQPGQQKEDFILVIKMDDVVPIEEWGKSEMLGNLRVMNSFVMENNVRMTYGVVAGSINSGSEVDGKIIGELKKVAGNVEIAMHGYDHKCDLVGAHAIEKDKFHEFVCADFGPIPKEMQEEWIVKGLGFFNENGFSVGSFVAPQYGYDLTTLVVLQEHGLANFDRQDFGVYAVPFFGINQGNYEERKNYLDAKIAEAIETRAPLLIDLHLQYVTTNGKPLAIDLLEYAINKIKQERSIVYKQVGEIT